MRYLSLRIFDSQAMLTRVSIALAIFFSVQACSSSSDASDYQSSEYYDDDNSSFLFGRDEFDEDAAREAAEDELSSESYDYSYGCSDDCSGHEAGWQWRADNGYPVEDPSTYGNSDSFAEGAMAYEEAVENRVDEMRDEYEDGEDPY